MTKDTFHPSKDTSYSAGLVFMVIDTEPQITLVLQKGGEVNLQKVGSAFVEKRTWKVPMGHFDSSKDQNLLDTAIREFEEETGLEFNFREISVIDNVNFRIKSQRPGQYFHQDTFYLITSKSFPDTKRKPDKQIEEVRFFSIYSLPVRPVKNATLAFGHRAKLKALLASSYSYLENLGIEVESIIDLL